MKWKRIIAAVAIVVGLGVLATVGRMGLRYLLRPSMASHGGTILVYQVDEKGESYTPEEMADTLKRRLDPSAEYNIIVTPLDGDQMKIRIPRSRHHSDRVAQCKELLIQVGKLEFRIVANKMDDADAIEAAEQAILAAQSHDDVRAELDALALKGKPPPSPRPIKGDAFASGHTYSWFELSRAERMSLDLSEKPEGRRNQDLWNQLAEARKAGRAHIVERIGLIFSRESRRGAKDKSVEFFVLCRDPKQDSRVTGADLEKADPITSGSGRPAVGFRFTTAAGDRFYELTSKNVPTGDGEERQYRLLAIILDGQIMSAPRLNAAIRRDGVIEGQFTQQEVDNLCQILRAGALPATLRPVPISETAVGPTK
jgi:preprotein translocase subunit SecD